MCSSESDTRLRDVDIQYNFNLYVTSLPEFRAIHPRKRLCYFPDEHKLKWHEVYSEPSCVTECSWSYASKICRCMPWFLRHHFKGSSVCEYYGNKCFRNLLNSRYDIMDKTGCSLTCLDDCHKYELTGKLKIPGGKSECSSSDELADQEAKCVYMNMKEQNLSQGLKNLSAYIRFV